MVRLALIPKMTAIIAVNAVVPVQVVKCAAVDSACKIAPPMRLLVDRKTIERVVV
jgi:hypothetical protein